MSHLPLQLRAGALLIAATAGYGLCIDILSGYGINLPGYFDEVLSPRRVSVEIWRATRHLVLVWVSGFIISQLEERLFENAASIVCWITILMILGILFRHLRFRRVIGRVLVGGLSEEYRVGDILVSDSLVSLAPVFLDIALAVAMQVNHAKVTEIDRGLAGQPVLLVASLPLGIRIKQCFLDYRRTGNIQHLANLAKYFVSNIPNVLKIHALVSPSAKSYLPIAMAVSSIYSLIWDLRVDWALGKVGRVYLFESKWYYMATVLDVILRFAWIAARPVEHILFLLQTLELFRRWVWIFFRVESEWTPKNDLPMQEL